MDQLLAMKTFVAVADHRGFAQAARKLGLSAPAVTRAIAALEAHLSIRLLQRTTRSVALTDAGAHYLQRARRILADVDEAERAARAERTDPAGRFVIAAPNAFGRKHVAPLLSAFLSKYPSVRGELMLADRMINLVEEGVDLAVRIGVLEDSTLRVRPAGVTRRIAVAGPNYLASRRAPRTPRELAQHATIEFSGLTPPHEWRFYKGEEELRIAIEPVLITNSADAAIAHAVRDGGIALVLAYQAREELESGALKIVLASYEPKALPIQLVYPGSRLPSANVRAFIELATETARWSFV